MDTKRDVKFGEWLNVKFVECAKLKDGEFMKNIDSSFIFLEDYTMIVRNSKSLIYGNCAGLTHYSGSLELIKRFLAVSQSIKNKNHICPSDIQTKLSELNIEIENSFTSAAIVSTVSAALTWVQPLAFSSIYGYSGTDFDTLINQVISAQGLDESESNTIIEYVHLLHDILWNKVTKETILEILPELDILESELPTPHDARDDFFIGLWCFIMTDSYEEAINKVLELSTGNLYIMSVTGSLAGLYYGFDSIPEHYVNNLNELYDVESHIF